MVLLLFFFSAEKKDDRNTLNLFNLVTVTSPTESLCDHTSNDIRGHISSLNFPNQYPDYVKCTYRIKAANSHYCQVRLALRDIDIQASPACDKDYLYIKGERVCGHDLAPRESKSPSLTSAAK